MSMADDFPVLPGYPSWHWMHEQRVARGMRWLYVVEADQRTPEAGGGRLLAVGRGSDGQVWVQDPAETGEWESTSPAEFREHYPHCDVAVDDAG